MTRPALLAPAALMPAHDTGSFDNGRHESLDRWLRERALASEGRSARTYVVCPHAEAVRVVGYFCVASAMAERIALPSAKLRSGMPDQIPMLLIGRLAVDKNWQGQGLGSALLADAIARCEAAASIIGARAVIAHAIDAQAVQFYENHGFLASPLGERVMLLPLPVR